MFLNYINNFFYYFPLNTVNTYNCVKRSGPKLGPGSGFKLGKISGSNYNVSGSTTLVITLNHSSPKEPKLWQITSGVIEECNKCRARDSETSGKIPVHILKTHLWFSMEIDGIRSSDESNENVLSPKYRCPLVLFLCKQNSLWTKLSVCLCRGTMQEVPAFLVAALALVHLYRTSSTSVLVQLLPFTVHYGYRSLIFPLLIRTGVNIHQK